MRSWTGGYFTDLALSHSPQCVDDGQLDIQVRCLIQESHHRLDHLRYGLLELAMLLG